MGRKTFSKNIKKKTSPLAASAREVERASSGLPVRPAPSAARVSPQPLLGLCSPPGRGRQSFRPSTRSICPPPYPPPVLPRAPRGTPAASTPVRGLAAHRRLLGIGVQRGRWPGSPGPSSLLGLAPDPPWPGSRTPTPGPTPDSGSGVSCIPGRLEVTVRAAALAPPSMVCRRSASSRPPVWPLFTFSAPARPCRSRSEAAMAVTRAQTGRPSRRAEVAPD